MNQHYRPIVKICTRDCISQNMIQYESFYDSVWLIEPFSMSHIMSQY